ncbi:hypothetical protein APHAL10511_002916 [Amanita phalloides]|nr:hypothetical protein APHAL10511_002916 [Amanita phalloides]
MEDLDLVQLYEISQRDFAMRVAALTLLFYDHALTLTDEVELFWTKPWTIVTYLFFWSRYGGLAMILSGFFLLFGKGTINPGAGWFMIETWLGILSLWAVEIMLQLRLFALYNCSRRLLFFVGSIFTLYVLSFVVLCVRTSYQQHGKSEPFFIAGHTYCIPMYPWKDKFTFWLIIASFDALIIGLTLHRGYWQCHLRDTVPALTDLCPTLLRDSLLYMFFTGFAYIANVILCFVDNRYDLDTTGTASEFGFVMPIIMGSRMTINIRKVFTKHRQGPLTPSQISLAIPGLKEPTQYV